MEFFTESQEVFEDYYPILKLEKYLKALKSTLFNLPRFNSEGFTNKKKAYNLKVEILSISSLILKQKKEI